MDAVYYKEHLQGCCSERFVRAGLDSPAAVHYGTCGLMIWRLGWVKEGARKSSSTWVQFGTRCLHFSETPFANGFGGLELDFTVRGEIKFLGVMRARTDCHVTK